MDGTLTLPVHDFEEIRTQLGIESGAPILEAIEKMPEERAKEITQKLHDMEMQLAYQAEPQPGTIDLLEKLRDRGKQLGILTRNGGEITLATLNAIGLEGFFEANSVVSRDDCAPKVA